MVKLEVVEDESFLEKPATTLDGEVLLEDDDDYTDTGPLLLFFFSSDPQKKQPSIPLPINTIDPFLYFDQFYPKRPLSPSSFQSHLHFLYSHPMISPS